MNEADVQRRSVAENTTAAREVPAGQMKNK